jgi:hypothetical protein
MLSFQANAEDQISIIGGGTLSCGKWVAANKSRNETQQQVFIQWVAEFTGSYNWYSYEANHGTIHQPDLETISLWLTNYCNDNPTHSAVQSSAALVQHLGGKATKFKWQK